MPITRSWQPPSAVWHRELASVLVPRWWDRRESGFPLQVVGILGPGPWALGGLWEQLPVGTWPLQVAIPNEAKDGLGFLPSLERDPPAVRGLGSLVVGSLWGREDRVLKNQGKKHSQSPR